MKEEFGSSWGALTEKISFGDSSSGIFLEKTAVFMTPSYEAIVFPKSIFYTVLSTIEKKSEMTSKCSEDEQPQCYFEA